MAEVLAERCRAGVGVNVLLDAVGSSKMPKPQRRLLRNSGCHLAFYHSLNPLSIKRINHRNHRRILVVDGRVGFSGGTGIGEKWTGDGRRSGHWRQTDVQVEGPIVRFLQAAFAENWRDTTGILLGGDAYFPPVERRGPLTIQSVKSSPASGAAEAYASQAHFGRALEGGVKIHEYGPAMLHAKTMVVDGQWVSIGSANIDNRSFAPNNELNLTFMDRALAAKLTRVFEQDLAYTKPATLEDWRRHHVRNLFYLPLVPLRDQL
jgi:cardiolipin synthase A/B